MESNIMQLSELYDKNGNAINSGDEFIYNGKHYIAIANGKDGNGYIGHPVGNNPDTTDLIIDDIVDQIEITK